MIDRKVLREIARSRFKDAHVLLTHGRYDGAVYLAGYAIELYLKARICRTLGWAGFPETRSEFQNYSSFRTHDLDTLLHLSGCETKIRTGFLADWSTAAAWDPEVRYRSAGSAGGADARAMLASVRALMKELS